MCKIWSDCLPGLQVPPREESSNIPFGHWDSQILGFPPLLAEVRFLRSKELEQREAKGITSFRGTIRQLGSPPACGPAPLKLSLGSSTCREGPGRLSSCIQWLWESFVEGECSALMAGLQLFWESPVPSTFVTVI